MHTKNQQLSSHLIHPPQHTDINKLTRSENTHRHTGAENGRPKWAERSVAAGVGGNVNTLHSQPVEKATGNKLLFIYSLTGFCLNGSRLCVLALSQEVRKESEKKRARARDWKSESGLPLTQKNDH